VGSPLHAALATLAIGFAPATPEVVRLIFRASVWKNVPVPSAPGNEPGKSKRQGDDLN
jgi:hypothetical protein